MSNKHSGFFYCHRKHEIDGRCRTIHFTAWVLVIAFFLIGLISFGAVLWLLRGLL